MGNPIASWLYERLRADLDRLEHQDCAELRQRVDLDTQAADELERLQAENEALRADEARLDALAKAATMAANYEPLLILSSASSAEITGGVGAHDCPWRGGPHCADALGYYCDACSHIHDLDLDCDGDDTRGCIDALAAKVATLEEARDAG